MKPGKGLAIRRDLVPPLRKAQQAADDAQMRRDALEQSEARYRLLLASASEGIYGIDPQGRFTFVNHAATELLGFTQEQIIGQDGHALIHQKRADGSFYPAKDCPIYRVLRSGESVQVEDDVFWRSDGTCFPVAYRASPIFEDGQVSGACSRRSVSVWQTASATLLSSFKPR